MNLAWVTEMMGFATTLLPPFSSTSQPASQLVDKQEWEDEQGQGQLKGRSQ